MKDMIVLLPKSLTQTIPDHKEYYMGAEEVYRLANHSDWSAKWSPK
jgi:hypothetical protein